MGTLHLYGEVHVAGGVDDVDAVVFPEAGCGSGGNGDAALLLLLHPVHGGGAVIRTSPILWLVRGVDRECARGRGGLAGVDVRHDADVPVALLSGWVRAYLRLVLKSLVHTHSELTLAVDLATRNWLSEGKLIRLGSPADEPHLS